MTDRGRGVRSAPARPYFFAQIKHTEAYLANLTKGVTGARNSSNTVELKLKLGDVSSGTPRPSVIGEMPEPLHKLNEIGTNLWYDLGQRLIDSDSLTVNDINTFWVLCSVYEVYVSLTMLLQRWISRVDVDILDIDKVCRGINNARKESFTMYEKCCAQFGLSPADRQRVELPGAPNPTNRMQELLTGGN